jgi:hypothetical protein
MNEMCMLLQLNTYMVSTFLGLVLFFILVLLLLPVKQKQSGPIVSERYMSGNEKPMMEAFIRCVWKASGWL